MGELNNIKFRSSWEAALMYFLDNNPKILGWASETVIIPYVSPVDDKVHRYLIDFWIQTSERGIILVEVKPQIQCLPPRTGKGRQKSRVLAEASVYAVNSAKWQAAEQYARANGWRFEVWDEVTLRNLGVVIPQRT